MEEMEVSQCSSILSMEFLLDEVQKASDSLMVDGTSLCDLPFASGYPPRSLICGQAFSSPPPTSSFLQVAAQHSNLHFGYLELPSGVPPLLPKTFLGSSCELLLSSMQGDCASPNVSPPPLPPFAPPLHSAPLPLHLGAPHFPSAAAMEGCMIKNTVAQLLRLKDDSSKRRERRAKARAKKESSLFPTVETSGDSSAEPIPELPVISRSTAVPAIPKVAQCWKRVALEPVTVSKFRQKRSFIR